MKNRLSVYGVINGRLEEQWLMHLTISPEVQSDVFPAESCIIEALAKRGCKVTSIRKHEVLEHELI